MPIAALIDHLRRFTMRNANAIPSTEGNGSGRTD
jgi:hypothetical protein